MQLNAVTVTGFRGYRDSLTLMIEGSITTLVGRNDAGKSSIFEALDVFFGQAKLDITDFTVGSDEPLSITCTFTALPTEVVLDSERSTSLKDEHLLDANSNLSITKTWMRSKLSAPSIYANASHPTTADGPTSLLNEKLAALKSRARASGIEDSDVGDRRTSSAYRQAIWRSALSSGDMSMQLISVPLSSEDGKSVWAALSSYMPEFHLFRADRPGTEADQLAQDPAKAAIKAVLDRHEEQLTNLSITVQKEVTDLLADVVGRLAEVAPGLADSLTPTDPQPVWSKAFSGLQFIDENNVPLSKRGSGTRRLVLLSFFRATAEKDLELEEAEEAGEPQYRRGVITAVEEPETALHADLQTDIVNALLDIGELPHRQVLLTTHSANLMRLVPTRSIRYITRQGPTRSVVTALPNGDAKQLIQELNKSLGIFTDHNVRCFVLIEGRNDVAALKALSAALSEDSSLAVTSFSTLEEQGRIAFMPIGGGGNASLWESTLNPFRRDEVHIMDSDKESAADSLKPEMQDLLDRADARRHVYILARREMENYLPKAAIVSEFENPGFEAEFERLQQAKGPAEFIDVPMICAEAAHNTNPSTTTEWVKLADKNQNKKESAAKKALARAFAHESTRAAVCAGDTDLLEALQKISALASD
jgi:putative ATP-dependent endonuclease of OLD family